jgi:hypothetical protein
LLLICLIAGTASAAAHHDKYLRENRLFEAELTLARKPDIYLVFNLKEKIAYIKARGIALRKLQMNHSSCWGNPVLNKVYRLKNKWTFLKPDRETIKPGASKGSDDFKIDALELADMPSRYTLVLDNGAKIYVTPLTEGVVSGMGNFLYASMRFFIRPLSMLWSRLQGQPYTAIDMALEKNDARALYWSFSEGSGAVIYTP